MTINTSNLSDLTFRLEEIQWDNHYPAHPELIPFENRVKKIIEELEPEQSQAENKLYKS